MALSEVAVGPGCSGGAAEEVEASGAGFTDVGGTIDGEGATGTIGAVVCVGVVGGCAIRDAAGTRAACGFLDCDFSEG